MIQPRVALLESPIIDFFRYFFSQLQYLLNLMVDDAITNIIGVNFVYILIGFLLVWLAVNTFLIRPISVPLDNIIISAKSIRSKYSERVTRMAERDFRESYEFYKYRRDRNASYASRYKYEKSGGKYLPGPKEGS